ncbi:MAG: prepilin-type N-terminal cleavage/methylation domain-containing protein [Gammaproteobacteria bacterium]
MRAISATGNSRRGAPCARRQSGFTLMELLVVVAILVLLSSALPLALDRALPGRRVMATTQKLQSAIRDAESLSVARGRPVRLEFRDSGMSGDLSLQFPSTTRVVLKDGDGLELHALSVYPEGTATEANIFVSERTHLRTLHLSGVTGRVTVEVPARAR